LSSWPWGVFGAYDVQSAYGYIFDNGYDGVHAINWTNGHIDWSFNAPSAPFETPYNGGFAWHATGYVADGKLYTFTAEHTPSQPITRGLRLYCINATTGANIWNISAYSGVGGSRTFPGAIADGYLTFASSYDGVMYVFGKGPSKTTVTVGPKTIAQGAKVVIEGTVLDQSIAQPDTPCVSQDSMTTYMEYLHMNQPVDGIYHNVTVTGVPVQLYAVDSAGVVTSIGTTNSDSSGSFGIAWAPPKEDTYKITANFAGDASYSSSWAETTLSVGPAPQEPQQNTNTQQQTIPDYSMLFAGLIAAIVIAILIGVVNLIALRKRQ
jgi:outer membrane protein assembly factor BamB